MRVEYFGSNSIGRGVENKERLSTTVIERGYSNQLKNYLTRAIGRRTYCSSLSRIYDITIQEAVSAADREIQEAKLQLRSTQRHEEKAETRLVDANTVSFNNCLVLSA